VRTELHFHLLPDVDDGPRDDIEAVELARLAVFDGTGRIVVTPHVHLVELGEVRRRLDALRARLRAARIDLQLAPGGELSLDHVGSLDHGQLELIAQGPREQRWLLLEAPLFPTQIELSAAADELRAHGFGVLIAHPERSPGTSLEQLRRQVSLGSVLQINASSVAGRHGRGARDCALELARSGLPFVIASDAHSPERPPLMTLAGAELEAAGIESQRVHAALDTLPEALLFQGLGAANPAAGLGPACG
jgi:protein-tyrosine phosphatase